MGKPRKRSANPRKTPAQDRSRATVDAIVEAAARVLVKHGYEAFTTNHVAEKAGVSIGSLYQYFPNKDALLSELMRRHVVEIERGVEEMAEFAKVAPLNEVIRVGIEQNVQSHLVDTELHRVLSEEVPRLGPLNWKKAFVARMEQRVRQAFQLHRKEIKVRDLDLAVYIVTRTTEAVIHNAASERPQDLESGALAEELTRMLVSFLSASAERARRVTAQAAE